MENNKKPLSKQVIDDFDKMIEENDHMSKSNAIRNLTTEWNMPYNVIKQIIDNR